MKLKYEETIDILVETIDSAPRGFAAGGKVLVDPDEMHKLFIELRNAYPDDVRLARKVVTDKRRVLEEAKKDAEKIRNDARIEANKLVEESNIVAEAKDKAEGIIADAHREADSIAAQAKAFALQVENDANSYRDDLTRAAHAYFIQKLRELEDVLVKTRDFSDAVIDQARTYEANIANYLQNPDRGSSNNSDPIDAEVNE